MKAISIRQPHCSLITTGAKPFETRFAWEFADVKRFRTPIPARGQQGFFNADVDLTGNELLSL
jgi:hypothetical protein